jgi:hypothetical protein
MPRLDTAGQPWRLRLAAIAEENKALFENHPWAATGAPTNFEFKIAGSGRFPESLGHSRVTDS